MSLQVPGPALLSDSTTAVAAGTTPVGTSGIAPTQVAYGDTTANTIKGSSQLLFVESDAMKFSTAVTGGIQIYNTADQTTNYERLEVKWSASVAFIQTAKGGTGNNRDLYISTAGEILRMRAGASSSGWFEFGGSTTSVSGAVGYLFSSHGSTATSGTNIGISFTPTYNQAASTAANTDFLVNRIQTAVGSGAQLLIDAQVGGTSQLSISNIGRISVKQNTNASAGTVTLVAGSATVNNTSITANSIVLFCMKTTGGTPGAVRVSAITAATSFVVTGIGTDTSTYNWVIVEAAP